MTTHTYPDGTVASCPDGLDLGEVPPTAAVDAMTQAARRVGLTDPASFIPAVHDVHRDAVLTAAVAWRQEGDWDAAQAAQQRLADAIDRYLAGAR